MTRLRCISPIDGSIVTERALLQLDDANAQIDKARQAQQQWQRVSLQERRRRVLEGIANLGKENDEITQELALQMGRPVCYQGEFGGVTERSEYMGSIAEDALAPLEVENSDMFKRYIRRAPLGVVLVIAPWNYPYLTAVNTLVPGLIAGNSVVLKHASQTPLVGERIAAAMHRAGVPDEVMQNVFLDHSTTSSLIAAGAFDFVNFTGSVEGGKSIGTQAAQSCTPVGLELGGKDPAYVMQDADLAAAVATLVDGAMFNSGQCCCGIERIYVARGLFDGFVARAVAITNNYCLGNPLDQATTLGPMAQPRLADKVRAQVAKAVSKGAKPLIDAVYFPQDGGNYLMPQILIDVDHTMEFMLEENFGPVVGIMPVDSDEQAVALINDSKYGLSASLWTQDSKRGLALGERIQTGTVFINRADYVDPALCWAGCKLTGRGGSLSQQGYHNLTRTQSFHCKQIKSN